MDKNEEITILDLSANDIGTYLDSVRYDVLNDMSLFNHTKLQNLASIEEKIERNREILSRNRRNERRERGEQYEEEFKSRNYVMEVEAVRLEKQAIQERRLARLQDRLVSWKYQTLGEEKAMDMEMQELMTEAEERKAANKGKKKKKK